MKKMLSAVLTWCLCIVMLTAAGIPVQAASAGSEKALQSIYYYDAEKEMVLDESTTGVLVKNSSSNLVITIFSSKEDEGIYTVFTTENDDIGLAVFSQSWNQVLYIYEAASEFGEAEGFTPGGTVTEGEAVYLVLGWDENGNKGGYETIATAYENGLITLLDAPGEWSYPVPVLNSSNEVCAVYYGEACYTLLTDEETFYGDSKPAEEDPPAKEESPADEETPASTQSTEYKKAGALPELEEIYEEVVAQKKSSDTGTIVITCMIVLAVILLVAIASVKKKNKQKSQKELNEAEEGTRLADEPEDTGLLFRFRNGKEIFVDRSFTIGRAPDNDIVTPNNASGISGHHCEILLCNGNAYLQDKRSTNGTFINGRRIPVSQLVQLQPGMIVSLGSANSSEAFRVENHNRSM